MLLVTDDDYLPVLTQLLEGARSSVDILAYSFAMASAAGKISFAGAPYQVAQQLVSLKKKYKSKIKIRLYIEGRRDTADRNGVTAAFLKKNGVQVKYGATHAKGFCVDGRYVLFGSTNLSNQSITKNYETNLLLDEPKAVEGFRAYFEHLWAGGEHGGIELGPPMIADGGFKDALIEMIADAKKSLEFSIYFFQQSEIEAAFIRAHKRGIKITGFVHNHFSFATSYVRRTHKTISRLSGAGIKGLYLAPPHLFTHSKYLIQDRKVLALGTGNWLDEDVNIHPQLYIRLSNPALAKQLALHLGRQIKAAGEKFKD